MDLGNNMTPGTVRLGIAGAIAGLLILTAIRPQRESVGC